MFTDYNSILNEISQDLRNASLGILKGYSCGIKAIDKLSGRMDRGQLWTIGGYTGCFAKGTPVLTKNGYVPIEMLKAGDMVATFSDKIEFNPVEFLKVTSNKPKPMIEFSYESIDTITATYDHPFFNGEKYYPLYQLLWGKMKESQRIQLKSLCDQYGQDIDHKTLRGVTHSDSQTYEAPITAFKSNNEEESAKKTRVICSITERISTEPKEHTKIYTTKIGNISGIKVKKAQTYYGIGVKDVHTYIVGRSQLPVHNTGKSFFIFNMIEGIFQHVDDPKVSIFSTELSVKQYVQRHLFLRAGLWKLEFEQSPKIYLDTMQKTLEEYREERIFNHKTLNIFGDVLTLEEIEQYLDNVEEGNKPNIIFIDYVQELSVDGKFIEKDTMPIIGAKLKMLAKKHKCTICAVSQINQSDSQLDIKNINKMPFSYGKQLNQASHVALVLSREKVNGELLKILDVDIIKSRDGETGTVSFAIHRGYKLNVISKENVKKIKQNAKNQAIEKSERAFI